MARWYCDQTAISGLTLSGSFHDQVGPIEERRDLLRAEHQRRAGLNRC
jgi:hypothetical protein